MKPVRMSIGGIELAGELDDSAIAERIVALLPLECHGETWGQEIYFPVALKSGNAAPVEKVKVGDIAYWPDGPDLCVFFGPTPKSNGDDPIVASPVTVIGRFRFQPGDFERIMRERRGILVRLESGQ